MRNGPRINLITIQHKQPAGKDGLKQPITQWATFAQAYAAISAKPGRQTFDEKGKQRFSETTYVFNCAYSDVDGVTDAMRISFENKVYDIVNVIPDLAKRQDTDVYAVLNS